MWRDVSLRRDAEGLLARREAACAGWRRPGRSGDGEHAAGRATDRAAALAREESRGGHYRLDYPDRDARSMASYAAHSWLNLHLALGGERRWPMPEQTALRPALRCRPGAARAGRGYRPRRRDHRGHDSGGHACRGPIVAREAGVVAGLPIAQLAFAALDPNVHFEAHVADGDAVEAGATLAQISGEARALLTAERAALNFLGGSPASPRWRRAVSRRWRARRRRSWIRARRRQGCALLEKYAVRMGGARNHRAGLDDGILIKGQPYRRGGQACARRSCKRASMPRTCSRSRSSARRAAGARRVGGRRRRHPARQHAD